MVGARAVVSDFEAQDEEKRAAKIHRQKVLHSPFLLFGIHRVVVFVHLFNCVSFCWC